MPGIDFVPLGEFEITYLDGSTEIARSNFGAIMELEAEYLTAEHVPNATVTVRALWLFLGRPKESLDAWAATVHNFTPMKAVDSDPSSPAVGDG